MQSTRIEAQELLARLSRRRRLYRRLMCVLSAAVTLITFAMLTFPGVTMERTAVCSAQPHTHEDSCYQQNLICGEQERPASPETVRVLRCTWQPHQHTAGCLDEQGGIACGYTADYWHEHAAACYRDGSLVCPLAHRERHEHTDDCYEQQPALHAGGNHPYRGLLCPCVRSGGTAWAPPHAGLL